MKRLLALCAVAAVASEPAAVAGAGRLLFVCSPANELMASAQRATPAAPPTQRFDRIDQALVAARRGDSALLVLADAGYPSTLPVAVPVAVAGPGSHASVDTRLPLCTRVRLWRRKHAYKPYGCTSTLYAGSRSLR